MEAPFTTPVVSGALPARDALSGDVQRIDRLAGGHEQAVAPDATEADVGAAFGELDAADRLALWREDHHPVEVVGPLAPAAPDVPVGVAAHAVCGARAAGHEDPLAGQAGGVVGDVEHMDRAG